MSKNNESRLIQNTSLSINGVEFAVFERHVVDMVFFDVMPKPLFATHREAHDGKPDLSRPRTSSVAVATSADAAGNLDMDALGRAKDVIDKIRVMLVHSGLTYSVLQNQPVISIAAFDQSETQPTDAPALRSKTRPAPSGTAVPLERKQIIEIITGAMKSAANVYRSKAGHTITHSEVVYLQGRPPLKSRENEDVIAAISGILDKTLGKLPEHSTKKDKDIRAAAHIRSLHFVRGGEEFEELATRTASNKDKAGLIDLLQEQKDKHVPGLSLDDATRVAEAMVGLQHAYYNLGQSKPRGRD